ncbi:MAG: hypothetical protein OEW39_11280 [Deltaproteobacteria bacterium]|nr:hypothetical protein [Deltaproteobacteria bacterium]
MSMDPSKWIPFETLSERTKERITTAYPYLKLDHSVFQDKASGVFMKQTNNVKIEKLLDPENARHARPIPVPAPPSPPASGSGRLKKG